MQNARRVPLWRHKRSVFWLFLATYILISAISLPLTAYSHMRVNRVLQNKIGETTNAQLKQSAQTVNGLLSGLRQAVVTMTSNAQNTPLLYADLPLKPDDVYRLTQYINRTQETYIAGHDIYDLYTYFAGMDSVVTRSTRYGAESFFRLFLQYEGVDYAQWHAGINRYAYMRYHSARTLAASGGRRSLITLSMSLSQSPASSRQVYATVVAAMDVQTVAQAFEQTGFLDQGQVILSLDGQELCTLGQPLYPTEALDSLPFEADSAVWTSVDGQRLLLLNTGIQSAGGVEYSCVIPAEGYLHELRLTQQVAFTILGIELLLCLALSVLFAWVNFSPIRRATEKLSAAVSGPHPVGNEIDLITDASLALFHENQRIAKTLAEQRQTMRSSLLRQLLLGGIAMERMAWDSADLQFEHPDFAVILLHVEDGGDMLADDSVQQQLLLEYTLLNLMIQHIEAYFPSFGTEMGAERIAVLVNLPPDVHTEALWRICNDFSDLCFAQLEVLASTGISDIHTGVGAISEAYKSAATALEHVRLWEPGNIALYEQIHRGIPSYPYTQEKENTVLHGIRPGKMQEVRQVIDDILRRCDHQPIAYVRGVFYDIAGTGMKLLGEMGVEPDVVFAQADGPMRRIDAARTLEDMHSTLLDVLGAISESLAADRSQRNEQLYSQVNRMIEEHFQDSGFSLSQVAAHFGLNASYLSHLYKKQSGENFIDTLNSVRIGHARRLLRETDEPITKIAAACGYISAAYFSRAFKRLEGCTPGQYRMQ